MSSTNFGLPHVLDVQVNAPIDGDFYQVPQPDREKEIIRQSKQSLHTHHDRPHFQFIALDAPHFGYDWHPDFDPPYGEYDPAAKFNAFPSESDIRRVKNRYLNALAWADFLVADYLDFLKQEGRYDDALIIITGDHGEEFHEHGSWFHCSSLHPEQTSVPIMIKWPRGTRAPARASASHLDLLPSLMDFLAAPSLELEKLPGHSLLRESDEEPTRITITSFCGITGISMAWRRENHTATFRWDNPWSSKLPKEIHLDDIVGPEGSLNLGEPAEWDQTLRRLFPDAFERYFIEWRSLPVSD
jgi:arylsulfatase A-like enzyme